MGTKSNTDSGKWLKSGKDTRANIESNSGIDLPSCDSGSHSCLNSISGRDNFPKCQYGSENANFGQVQMGVIKLNLGFQNMILESINKVRDIRIRGW